MDLRDATLMLANESAGHPALSALARSVYERLARARRSATSSWTS
jgi:hypothetical protein